MLLHLWGLALASKKLLGTWMRATFLSFHSCSLIVHVCHAFCRPFTSCRILTPLTSLDFLSAWCFSSATPALDWKDMLLEWQKAFKLGLQTQLTLNSFTRRPLLAKRRTNIQKNLPAACLGSPQYWGTHLLRFYRVENQWECLFWFFVQFHM